MTHYIFREGNEARGRGGWFTPYRVDTWVQRWETPQLFIEVRAEQSQGFAPIILGLTFDDVLALCQYLVNVTEKALVEIPQREGMSLQEQAAHVRQEEV